MLKKTAQTMLPAAVAAVFISVLISGCGGGGGTPVSAPQAVTTAVTLPAGGNVIAGRVIDTSGAPVAGASVAVQGAGQAVTGADGGFMIPAPQAAAEGTLLKAVVSSPGHADTFHEITIYPDSFQNGKHEVTFRTASLPASEADATRAEIVRAGGVRETVLAQAAQESGATVYKTTVNIDGSENAVIFTTPPENGTAPSVEFAIGSAEGSGPNAAAVLGRGGAVTGSIIYGNPADEQDLEFFPGGFRTISDTGFSGGGEGALVSAGFARITLNDESGAAIRQFAPGMFAEITMTVPSGALNPETGLIVREGDTIPIFVFDEVSGEWVVEHESDGTVKRAAVQSDGARLFVKFTTTHLTWFNLDWKTNVCPKDPVVRIKFRDTAGNPVSGVTLYTNTGGGWRDAPRYVADDVAEFINTPAAMQWQVWAEKDGIVSQPVTISGCGGEYTIVIEQPQPECTTDVQCDDGSGLTLDVCRMPGQANAYCAHTACSPICSTDSQCDDGKPGTNDLCIGGGTCGAYCAHTACVAECSAAQDCDDGNPQTTDACMNAGTCGAVCAHTGCPTACYNDEGCSDGNPLTVDSCVNPGTCGASCTHEACKPQCSRDSECEDDDDGTVDICANAGTCGASCTNSLCVTECTSDAGCDDGNAATLDKCESAGGCDTTCVHTACSPACSVDAACDDSNPLTLDICTAPGTCGAACANTACSPACFTAQDCDDLNPLTIDTCSGAGACGAACAHSQCSPLCSSDAECSDGNPATSDRCENPGQCSAYCMNTQCTPVCAGDSDCEDGISSTLDVCRDAGTCAAACEHILNGWLEMSAGSASGGGISANPGESGHPNVARTQQGWPVVVWFDSTSGNYEIYAKAWNGSAWMEMGAGSASGGGISANSSASQYPAVASDDAGNVYVVWYDRSGDYEIYIKKWNGAVWSEVGTGSASGGGISNNSGSSMSPQVMIDGQGNPVVAWDDNSGGDTEIYVKRWNGSSWVEMGTGSASGGGISNNGGQSANVKLAKDSLGNPVVVWRDNSTGNSEVYVRRWSGTAWVEMGAGSASGGGISANAGTSSLPGIYQDAAGNPVVAWEDDTSGNNEIYVKRWTGSSWAEVGAGSASGGGISANAGTSLNPSVALDASGNPVIGWYDSTGGGYDIYVKRWNGTAWVEAGAGSASGRGVSDNAAASDEHPAIMLDGAGGIVAAWWNYTAREIFVKRFAQ